MKLIDPDVLYEAVEDHVATVSVCPTAEWARGKTEMKKICLEEIRNAPIIDAVPIRHGQWIKEVDRKYHSCWRCSECGFMEAIMLRFHYCPGCGAKMDGGSINVKQ